MQTIDKICILEHHINTSTDLNEFEVNTATVLCYGITSCTFFHSQMYTHMRNRILRYVCNGERMPKTKATIFPVNGLQLTCHFRENSVCLQLFKVFPSILMQEAVDENDPKMNSTAGKYKRSADAHDSGLARDKRHKRSSLTIEAHCP